MQSAAFAAAGLEGWTYELADVEPAALPLAVAGLRAADVAGANVTIPHKVAVAGLVDELDAQALKAGAVNTVVNNGGRLRGLNTDLQGVLAAVAEVGLEPGPALRVLVLGAGGSARAVGAALAGCRLVFAARRPESADPPGEVVAWARRGELARDSDLVVNATPLGREGERALEPADLPAAGAVVDLVYREEGTPLLAMARAAGLRTADGWTVLVAQGAASFEAWTGRPAPLDAMRQAVRA